MIMETLSYQMEQTRQEKGTNKNKNCLYLVSGFLMIDTKVQHNYCLRNPQKQFGDHLKLIMYIITDHLKFLLLNRSV